MPRKLLIILVRTLADFIAVLAGFGLGLMAYHAIGLGKQDARVLPYIYLALFAGVLFIAIFRWMGLYAPGRSSLTIAGVTRLFTGYAAGSLVLAAATFFSRIGQVDPPSRLVLFYSLVIAFPLLRLERFLMRRPVARLQQMLGDTRTALIAGDGELARQLRRALERTDSPKYEILNEPCSAGRPILIDLEKIADERSVDILFVADQNMAHSRMLELQTFCQAQGIEFSYVPDLFEFITHDITIAELDGIPLIMRRVRGPRRAYLACKRIFDVIFSALALIILSPLFAFLAIVIRRSSPGPVFFSHERIGLNGKPFKLYKFRTMQAGIDPYAPSPRSSNDPRITRPGRFIRRKSLDELPQLLNILKGDMSIVGPRPEMPFIVDTYTPAHRARLNVRPGLTGVWQISAHRAADIHDVMDYDVYYVENQSFILDMLIILETVFYVLSGRGGC
ncbi:MAG: sugar transferase [Planctomycetes bacterium]|nr:sugar transferase [Planctomycetota bacterium]